MKNKGPFNLATIWTPAVSGGVGGGFDGVVAPSPTTDSKSVGTPLSAKTFGSFIDPNSLIASYSAVTTNADGTCSWSGSGLGPYTPTSADGDSGTLALNALDSSGNVLATAYHSYDRAAVATGSELLLDIDFTAADAATLSGSGNITTDSGGTVVCPYVIFTQTGSVVSESYATTGSSFDVVRATGNSVGGIAFGISSAMAACDPARDKLLIFVKFSAISSTPATNQNIIVSLGDVSNNISNKPNRGVMLNVASAGTDVDVNLRQYTSGVTTVKLADYGTAMPTSGNVLLEIDLDRVRGGWTDLASPTRSDVTVGSIGGSAESPSATLGTAPWTYILCAFNPQAAGYLAASIESIKVYRTRQGAS